MSKSLSMKDPEEIKKVYPLFAGFEELEDPNIVIGEEVYFRINPLLHGTIIGIGKVNLKIDYGDGYVYRRPAIWYMRKKRENEDS